MKDTVVSGMRPTGRLHLGNYWGALRNWIELTNNGKFSCYFFVADWHMLTTGYDDTSKLQENIREMVLDWLAAGLDPAKCVIFKQSDVPEHAELALLLSMITPLSWLENNPTWKEQLQELSKTKESKIRSEVGGRAFDHLVDIGLEVFKKTGVNPIVGLIQHLTNNSTDPLDQRITIAGAVSLVFTKAESGLGPPAYKVALASYQKEFSDLKNKAATEVIDANGLLKLLDRKREEREFIPFTEIIAVCEELREKKIITRDLIWDFFSYISLADTPSQRILLKDFADWLIAALDDLSRNAVPGTVRMVEIRNQISSIKNQNELAATSLGRLRNFQEKGGRPVDEMLRTHGFLGYPVLQAADILLYKGNKVPVGRDQVPHLELSREIARKFNSSFGDVLVEPKPILTTTPILPGNDGRKMSKSFGNIVELNESTETLGKKVMGMYTDPGKIKKDTPGHPDPSPENPPGCVVYALHKLYTPGWEKIGDDCRKGALGCVSCKKDLLLPNLERDFSRFRDERKRFESDPKLVQSILDDGARKARAIAQQTMGEVRRAMRLA